MKEFIIKCTYTQEHDDVADIDAQWDAVMHHLGDNGWTTDDCSEPYEDEDGDMCIDAALVKTCDESGDEITKFLQLCGEVCGDSMRIYGGGLTTSTKEGGL